jgi:methyltransferase family protein
MAATVAAYDRLAREYDLPSHVTTRALEYASDLAWRQAEPALAARPPAWIVETGAGTGHTTRTLRRAFGSQHVVVSDPAPGMLDVARHTVPPSPLTSFRLATALEAIDGGIERHGLVVAALADPYLDDSLFRKLGGRSARGARVLITVPSRVWALRERTYRLGIPHDSTRFRLQDGTVVVASSFVYERDELAHLLQREGFAVLNSGKEAGPKLGGRPRPEIVWVIAERI